MRFKTRCYERACTVDCKVEVRWKDGAGLTADDERGDHGRACLRRGVLDGRPGSRSLCDRSVFFFRRMGLVVRAGLLLRLVESACGCGLLISLAGERFGWPHWIGVSVELLVAAMELCFVARGEWGW